jgi:hypothetical protein
MQHIEGRGRFTRLGILCAAASAAVAAFGAAVVATPAHADPPPFRYVTASPVSGQVYNISSEKDGRCVDVQDAKTNNGATLQEFDCGMQWNQQFEFDYVGVMNGLTAWRIKPRYLLGTGPHGTDRCVDVYKGQATVNTYLQVWDCNDGWQQLFHIGSTAPTIQPIYDVLCVNEGVETDHTYGGGANYLPIVQADCPVGGGPYTGFWQFGQW